MYRRRFIVGATTTVPLLGGCAQSDDEQDIRDSDGDGVIDSEDYAPQDPEVQEKSDLVTDTVRMTATAAPTDTPTRTPTDTPTRTPTDTPTRTATSDVNSIRVTDSYWQGGTRIQAYGSQFVETVIHPDIPQTDFDVTEVLVLAYEYPRADFIAQATSDAFRRSDGTQTITVDVDMTSAPGGTRLQYIAHLVPADKSIEELTSDDVTSIMETDAFELSRNGTIERAPHPDHLEDDQGDSYSRDAVEGSYSLTVNGRTEGRDWTVNFVGYKSAYLQATDRSRGRSRPEYVSYELTDGTAPLLAEILDSQAEANGFTSKREKVEFVIDFVQRLPYVPDDVSKGFDDYTKFIIETLVELGGDCEDSAILLASVLEAEPFNYDMILIEPPGHMATGILSEDPRGYYFEYDGGKYSYIETTGEGWGIGDVPDIYQGEEAYLYQV